MKHYAKAAVVLSCLLTSAAAVAVPSTPKTEFNTYTFDALADGAVLVDHNVANKDTSFTDLIAFKLAAGSTYDLGFTATSNSNSSSKKFSSFDFTLYDGALMTLIALESATQTVGSTVGSFSSELSASGVAAGWYTLAVSGEAKSNGAKYSLEVSTFVPHAIPSMTPPIAANVPEPETYAMLLAGLGLMGFVARRRRRA